MASYLSGDFCFKLKWEWAVDNIFHSLEVLGIAIGIKKEKPFQARNIVILPKGYKSFE